MGGERERESKKGRGGLMEKGRGNCSSADKLASIVKTDISPILA